MGTLLAILGAIPGISTAVQFIVGKLFDSRVAIATAKIGGDRDAAVAAIKAGAIAEHEVTAKLSAFSGNRILTMLLVGFALPLMIHEWKVIVWDIDLGWGTTDPIRGQVADWANTIIAFMFGSATVLAVNKTVLAWLAKRD